MKCSRLAAWVLTLACAWGTPATALAAAPASWNDIGFSIDAKGMRLGRVLEQFGAAYGVHIRSSVNEAALLNARIKASSGTEFLDRLAAGSEFRWFVYNDTVYVVPRSDQASVRLEVGEDAVQDAKAALVGLGLFDPRFGWGELPDEGVVMVSGPRAYIDLVRGLLMPEQKEKAVGKGRQIMVFRLKYASAADRIINTRGQKEIVPGIKTILTGLLEAEHPQKMQQNIDFDAAGNKRSRRGPVAKGGAKDTGEAGESDNRRDKSAAAAATATAARGERPRIDADPSLNAIIIYDDIAKRATYLALIAELDIEPQQIEIEALIVDIDRSKLSELGVEWGVKSGNTTSTVNAGMGDSQGVDLPLPGATLLINNAARFYARLKAMEGSGDARVLAKPTVLTLDNVAAVLDLSQTSYVPLVGERVADLADITVGTMLRVVPRIVQEGASTRVRLEVDIEDGSMDKNSSKNNVTRSTISTQAIVNAQQTLMIGGYHAESVSRQEQKVPLLGDVPLLGNLFRSTNESHSTRERLFLLTPRITPTVGVAAAAVSRANKTARRLAAAEVKRQEAAAEPEAALRLPREEAKGEAVKAVPARLEPPKAEPVKAEPARVEPARVEPVRAEAARAEPVRVEAVGEDLARAGSSLAQNGMPASFRIPDGVDVIWPKKSRSIICKRPRPLLWP
ncbi:type III secretion protein C [Oxalobacteraceae bacterium GrIS 1.11]